MRKITVFLSGLIIIVLTIGSYIYEKQASISIPQLTPPASSAEKDLEPAELYPETDEVISYSLQNDALNITYNAGNDWIKVPVDKASLFQGEYQGNEEELIGNSYVLTEKMTGILYLEETNQEFVEKVVWKYTLDQGDSWLDSVIVDGLSSVRFRKVEFLNESFGYAILSGGRTMSQEYSIAYLTLDGGKTWEVTTEPPTTSLIAFGSFIDEQTGFLSYGTINPEEPTVYVTQDGGDTWSHAQFDIPNKYDRVFVQAENPVVEQDYITVLVNQGPNGDYAGGKVKGKFISKDNGLTWNYLEEVEPDESEGE